MSTNRKPSLADLPAQAAPAAPESSEVKGGMIVGPFKPPTPILTPGGTTSGGGTTTTTTSSEPVFDPVPKP